MSEFTWTPEQESILAHSAEQPARVLAGPGTGKSATVVGWVGRLLDEEESPPKVRLLTFTRAATGELARKVSDHPTAATLRPSTVHSFSISVLLQNEGVGEFPEPLRIADDWEQHEIIDPTLGRRIGVQPRRIKNLFLELASNWEALEERPHPRVRQNDRARFMAGWHEHRQVFGYTLLAELPWALMNALRDHPDLAGVNYDLLAVDEYQDLNACDLSVLKLLSERGCRIVGIGDDDQSIYSFRRAAPEGIRRFRDEYPAAADYPLSITHRCGSTIMEWAAYVISQDLGRDPEKPTPRPAEGSPPGEVALLSFAGQRAEPVGIAELVRHLVEDEEIPPEEVLVLLKGDYQGRFSKPIKDELAKRDLPFSDPDAVKNTLAEPNNRTLLACCRLLANREDSLAWATVLKLTPGIGPAFIDAIYDRAKKDGLQFGAALLAAHTDGLTEVPAASKARAAGLLDALLAWVEEHPEPDSTPEEGWGAWIVGLCGEDPVPSSSADLSQILHGVDELVEAEVSLGRFLAQLMPLAKDRAQTESRGVRIMTMAASKGLTVEAAVLASVEEGILPSLNPDADVDEERRLLYVAITRARRFLFCTWARQRIGPTARAGRSRVAARRTHSSFLAGGPVVSQDGEAYLRKRWGS